MYEIRGRAVREVSESALPCGERRPDPRDTPSATICQQARGSEQIRERKHEGAAQPISLGHVGGRGKQEGGGVPYLGA